MPDKEPKRVMAIAGLDPSGGAGLGADVAAIIALGGSALPLASCLTVQDGREFRSCHPVSADLLSEQFLLMARSHKPDAIKLGLLPDPGLIETIGGLLADTPQTPVFCDPVMRAGYSDDPMTQGETASALAGHILPRCLLATPNRAEALRLGAADNVEDAVAAILASGCANVLITTASEDFKTLTHLLFSRGNGAPTSFASPRRPGQYHGSGCALSAAIACHYAANADLEESITKGLAFVDECIVHGWRAFPDVSFLGFSSGSAQRRAFPPRKRPTRCRPESI